MIKKANIRAINTLLPVFGLLLLLLLSPCRVRNLIQAELDIPQTEVANKSKTTLSSSTCSNIEIVANSNAKEKSSNNFSTLLSTELELAFAPLSTEATQVQGARKFSASAVPFYILYQNFKDYL